ncbi:MAG TPA: 30S ribosomal protein S27ae [Methanocorpusculum sp.]|nr:30S ribosomal protein S27ae [Methanocorpusculum sp.]
MTAKQPSKKGSPKRSALYTVDNSGKVTTTHKTCPRCGDGIFMGGHKDRFACGKCGYTEFKK